MAASPFDTASPNMKAAQVLAGCYRVAVGAWSDERAPGWSATIPSSIQLDTAPVKKPLLGLKLLARTPATGVRGKLDMQPAWSTVGTDSLQIAAWGNGTSSINLFLRSRATGKLEGTARYFWDVIFRDPATNRWLWERYPTAPATLTAIPCA